MSKNVIFKIDEGGVRSLLKSKEAKECCKPYSEKILSFCQGFSDAGDGYIEEDYTGRFRNGYKVVAESLHAINSNHKHNTLEKAIGGAKR